MEKLYAYVDETGQDTKGTLFLLAVVVVGDERDALYRHDCLGRNSTRRGSPCDGQKPLLGTLLLHGYQLTADCEDGGTVTITPL
jgi:hypothetical protein